MRLRNPHLIHAVSFHGLTPTIDIEPEKSGRPAPLVLAGLIENSTEAPAAYTAAGASQPVKEVAERRLFW